MSCNWFSEAYQDTWNGLKDRPSFHRAFLVQLGRNEVHLDQQKRPNMMKHVEKTKKNYIRYYNIDITRN